MAFNDTLKMSIAGLSTHKTRSALTILGIVIGITSIILVMAIGQSAESLILSEVKGLGSTNIFIIPGRKPSNASGFGASILADSIKNKDFEDLKKKSNVPDAVRVVPIVFGPAVFSFGPYTYSATILGGTEDIAETYNLDVDGGVFISNDDVLQKSQVIVIGKKVATELFGLNNPIGEKIKIKDQRYRVIGVLASKGQSPFVNFDEAAIMPYTTAQQYALGIKYIQRVVVEAKDTASIPGMIKDVEILLRNNHNISDPAKDDFFIQTQADLVNTIGTITSVLTILLTSVAAISLVVGGIGIMNIMLVSVTERTREIGLRKALGATNGKIMSQFLTEAVILTVSGGLIGIIFGILLSLAVSVGVSQGFGLNFPFSLPLTGIAIGVSVSIAIGLAFGIFPARQAARKSPMEALRYE